MDELLKFIKDEQAIIKKDIKTLLQRTAKLEVKAAIWGLLGGAIPVMIGLGVIYLRSI